jgi:hypothetical protein
MPWLHFPKANMNAYGYIGDGIITSFLFAVALTVFLVQKNQFNFSKRVKITLVSIFSILTLIFTHKIYKVNFRKDNYEEINFLLSTAMAGMRLGSGVYLAAIVSFVLLIIVLTVSSGENESTLMKYSLTKILSVVTIMSCIILAILFWPFSSKDQNVKLRMQNEFKEMQLAFQLNDFDKFTQYIHPLMLKPLGNENYKNAIRGAKAYLDSKNISIKSVLVDSILHTEKKFNNIQSIIANRVIYATMNGDSSTAQRTLCVSENGGNSWYYYNLNNQRYNDVQKVYPEINANLKNYFSK